MHAAVLDPERSPFYQLQQVLEISTQIGRPELLRGHNLETVSRELANMHWTISSEKELTTNVKIGAIATTAFLALASLLLFQWTFGSILFHAVLIAVPAYVALEASFIEIAQSTVLEVCLLLHNKLPLKKTDEDGLMVLPPIVDRNAAPGSVVSGMLNSLAPSSQQRRSRSRIGTLHGPVRRQSQSANTPPLLSHLERIPQIRKLKEQKEILDDLYVLPHFLNASIQEGFTMEPSQGDRVGDA